MTDREEIQPDLPPGLQATMFRHTSYPGMDALVATVPKGKESSVEVQRPVEEAGDGRWFPLEGGWKVMCPYVGQDFDPDLFHIEKDAWDHVHCDGCHGSIDTGASCWVAKTEDDYFILCDNCHEGLSQRDDSA
jgi:hypothetical protein